MRQRDSDLFLNMPEPEDDGFEDRVRAIINPVLPKLARHHDVPASHFTTARCYMHSNGNHPNDWLYAIELPDGKAIEIGVDDSNCRTAYDVGAMCATGKVFGDIREFITGEPNPYTLPADWTPHDLPCGVSGVACFYQTSETPDCLYLVGDADDIIRLDHTGWFCDNLQDGTIKGIVYETVLSDCQEDAGYEQRYYAAATYDRGHGDVVWIDIADPTTCKTDAARRADDMAETLAEYEREYEAAFQSGIAAREKRSEAYRAGLLVLRQIRLARDIRTELGKCTLYRQAKVTAKELRKHYRKLRREAIAFSDEHRPYSRSKFRSAYVDGFGSV